MLERRGVLLPWPPVLESPPAVFFSSPYMPRPAPLPAAEGVDSLGLSSVFSSSAVSPTLSIGELGISF